jgi:hypothetical protein
MKEMKAESRIYKWQEKDINMYMIIKHMKNIKNIVWLLAMVVIFNSCKHKTEQVGPTLEETFGPFKIVDQLDADNKTPNFDSKEEVAFSASFSKTVDWTLTLKGQTSSITKTFTGKSKSLDKNTALWTGGGDHPAFANEKVVATLKFKDYPDSSTTSLNINGRGLNNYSPAGSVLVNDFDSGIAGLILFNENITFSGIKNTLGGKYYQMEGRENSTSSYFIGLLNIPVSKTRYPSEVHYPISLSDASQVYFNVWVYGYGPSSITRLGIDFQEDDLGNSTPGVYTDGTDDTYSYAVNVDWIGWKLVSVQYSKTLRSTNQGYGNSGNGKQEVDRILAVQFVLSSKGSDASSPVVLPFDNPIFTVGNPFNY